MMVSNAKNKFYSKGEIFLNKGDICKHGFLVISGCLKSYIIDKRGKEHVLQFAPENWFVSDIESYVSGKPSTTFIEAIEPTEVKLIPNVFVGNHDALNKEDLIIQNQKLIKNILATNKRLASILASSAEERYIEFTKTYPSLVQRLPLKLIASYIGITPEHLSVIRKDLTQK